MKNKLVKVTWRDICTLDEGWKSLENCVKTGHEIYENEYVTVGYLIYECDGFVLVASSVDVSGEEFNDVSMIMKSVIIKIDQYEQ